MGQCLTELLVYKLYSMLLWFSTSCAVGFEGRNWHRLSSVLGHWSPGGVLHVLHQGRFAAICAMNLAGNTCNDDDDDGAGMSPVTTPQACLQLISNDISGNDASP